MGIVKGFVKRIEIPGEGQFVSIRMLSHFELEEARSAKFEQMRTRMKALREVREAMPTARPTQAEAQAAVEDDPLVALDVLTLLRLGVTSWTYQDEETKQSLALDVTLFDDKTAPFVAREIARYSSPSSAELGKGSSSSIGT